MTNIPDWRDDPTVKATRERSRGLEAQGKALEARIRSTIADVREAERRRTGVENSLFQDRATPLDLMAARQQEAVARADADEAQSSSEAFYAELAQAKGEQEEAEAAAKARAREELRSLYLEAIERLEPALRKAVAADSDVAALWQAAGEQFPREDRPCGLANLAWRWNRLTPENLQSWRAWREEAGLTTTKDKAKAALRELKEALAGD